MKYAEFLDRKSQLGAIDGLLGPISFIYGLADPETGDIRYIGKSIRPVGRLRDHINDQSLCHRTNWIRSLKSRGLDPELIVLESVQGEWPWQEAERFWIQYAKGHGCNLVNGTSGGDGVSDLPAESRERIRTAWIGRKHKPESLAKMGDASRGRHKSEAMKEAMRQKMKGRKITWIGKISEANRKITSAQAEDIGRRIEGGEKVKDLAAEFRVHRTTISKINMGRYR